MKLITHLNVLGWLKALNPRAPKVLDFPRCSNAGIDSFVMMPKDPSPVDTTVEMLSQLHEEEATTLKPTFPVIDSQLLHCHGLVGILEED